jgi:phospholipase/carboxylesterase
LGEALVELGPGPLVVLLHGWAMRPQALSPFARSIGAGGTWVFPEGPVELPDGTRGWWWVDEAARSRARARGPRDLAADRPAGLDAARERFEATLARLCAEHPGRPLVVGGFSQGAMLACDHALRGLRPIDGLAVLSGSRLTYDDWLPAMPRLRSRPVLVAHGRDDPDLAPEAAGRLADDLEAAGARVDRVMFDGGHAIPLAAWRGVRRLVRRVRDATTGGSSPPA